MANGQSDGMWRTLAVALLSAVLAGGGYWLAIGRDKVDRSEVIEIVNTYSPFVRIGGQATIEELKITVKELNASVTSLTVEVAKLRAEVR